MADTTHTFIETRGFTAHVAQRGDGPPLLLLHGWPEFWATWEPMFENVEAGIAEDAGHFVHYECPDPAAVEIDRFFRRIGHR